jgi:hypothetical protein
LPADPIDCYQKEKKGKEAAKKRFFGDIDT